MAEYIKLETAIAELMNEEEYDPFVEPFLLNLGDKTDVQQFLENLPAADVVEVVRCKDCKYLAGVSGIVGWCTVMDVAKKEKGYCDQGERRDNDANGYKCSECGSDQGVDSDYCPNCGAKMDGGAE